MPESCRIRAFSTVQVRPALVLSLLICLLAPTLAQAQTEPVQFTVSGLIETTGPVPLERAQLRIFRAGTSELLAERIFSAADGTFSATFQANVIPNVGLDDPTLPPVGNYDGFWMGDARPNPFLPGRGQGLSLPFAAPSYVQSAPELEMFDIRGRRIHGGESMASGMYFYRLRFQDRVTPARKLVLLGATKIQPALQRVSAPDAVTPKSNENGGAARRRAEGSLDVDIAIVKPGYVTQFLSTTLESRVLNPVNATLAVEAAPTAQINVSGPLLQGEAQLFDGAGSSAPDGKELFYSWSFGDGIRGTRQNVAHVYSEPGTYNVELTVSSTFGAIDTASQMITIGAAAPPASTDAGSMGTVRDAIGNFLAGVTVSQIGGAATGVTDAQGVVNLTGLPTGTPMALLCEKDGYTTQIVRLTLPANVTDSEFTATLRSRRTAVPVAAIEDGTVIEGEDGVCIELPADALQTPGGTPATGAASVRMTPVDVASKLEAPAFPGSYEGVLSDGNRGLIASYGVAEFVIEQAGQELQLKPGSTAIVEIPVYTPGAAENDVIALWSVDETTGLWTEEGTGTVVASVDSPTGLAMRAEVGHFSWWNSDQYIGAPYVVMAVGRIVDGDGVPSIALPSSASTYVTARLADPTGATSGPSILIPWDGGIPLNLPPDLDIVLTGSALNGTKGGSVLVNGATGVVDSIVIPLDSPTGLPSEILLPVNSVETIDPAGEVDSFTFEAVAGQFFSVFVERANGSNLDGDLRVFAPDGTEIHMSSFGASATSFSFEVVDAGTYTIEVDGTANEPGVYRLRAIFSEVREVTLPSSVDADIVPGQEHVFLFTATAGEWFSANYVRREAIGFGNQGEIRIVSPSGVTVADRGFNARSQDSGLVQAAETGVYHVFFDSKTIEASYTMFIRDVPTIEPGGLVSGAAEERTTRYFRFPGNQDDFLRSALDKVINFSGSVSLVDGNNQPLSGQYNFGLLDGTTATVLPAAGDYFVKLDAAFTNLRTQRDYRVSLNNILPPETVTLDGAGRGQVIGGQIGLFGDVRMYQFDAMSGSGLAVELRPGNVSTLTTGMKLEVHRIGTGSASSPDQRISADLFAQHPGDVGAGILEYAGFTLPSTDTYLVVIYGPTPDDGAFDLVFDVVTPKATLTVDDDLGTCPGADTRSLVAASLAAPGGGLIDVCAGTYESIIPVPIIQPGVQFVGSATNEVIVRNLISSPAIAVEGANNHIANMTLEVANPATANGLQFLFQDGGIVEDVTIRGTTPTPDLKVAVDLGSGLSNITLRRVRTENSLRVLDGIATNVLIEDCQFEGGAGLIDLEGDGHTVQNNTWNSTAIGEVLSIQNGAGNTVLGNQITILTPDIGANLGTAAIQIEDDDVAGNLPTTIIRNNRITTNEAGFDLKLNRAGSSILCEQNLVRMTGTGRTALVVIPQQDTGTDVIIRNNVFDGLSSFEGVHIRWADWYGSAVFVNNTMRTDTGGSVIIQPTYPTIRVDLRSGTFTGALGVLLVNNILQGSAAGVAIEIPAATTIDSDYNLFNNYPTYYSGGTTSTGLNDLFGMDPMFTGANLELSAASPAVDSGAGTGDVAEVPTVDYSGAVRPQGGGTDRGAHEQ